MATQRELEIARAVVLAESIDAIQNAIDPAGEDWPTQSAAVVIYYDPLAPAGQTYTAQLDDIATDLHAKAQAKTLAGALALIARELRELKRKYG